MEICCTFCDVKYKENDEDIINAMKSNNDFNGWCEKCINKNIQHLKDNNKIYKIM
jgi:hypothetical protein